MKQTTVPDVPIQSSENAGKHKILFSVLLAVTSISYGSH